LGSRLTVWIDYYLDYEKIISKNYQNSISTSLPDLSNYVHDYYETEKNSEYSLSINTPGNIICFQSLSFYYPTRSDYAKRNNAFNSSHNILETVYHELSNNPNININQFINTITETVKRSQKSRVSTNQYTFTQHSNTTTIYNNYNNGFTGESLQQQKYENTTASTNKINNNHLVTTTNNINTTTVDTSKSHVTESMTEEIVNDTISEPSLLLNQIVIYPQLFLAFINKSYMKDESFIPYEKYKYKILKELVSTAHAQLYLVTEKNVAESGGFSHSSLNLNINSNADYCENLQDPDTHSSKNDLNCNYKTSSLSQLSRKHVLKIIYLTNEKNVLTAESEKRYKKMIKEALFLRELNHNNIQKFITSWV